MVQPDASQPPASQRPGVTLIEVIAAVSMLAVLLGSSVQILRALSTQQLAATRRAMALQAVQAITEEFANVPWTELTPAAADKLSVPAVAKLYLPGAALSAAVTNANQPIESKRLSVELRWNSPNGKPAAPLRVTTWVYPEDIANKP
jgi:prepilin-type N-terminal cleavage/methylation domain-containing protein